MNIFRFVRNWPWWVWIAAIDIVLILATIVHLHAIPYPGDSINPFNLAAEMNFAAWWAGVLLFVVGLLAFELYHTRRGRERWGWFVLALIGAGLSLDEMGSLHERLATHLGWWTFIPAGIAGGAAALYMLVVLLRNPQTRRTAVFVFCGLVLMSTAVVYEYFERIVEWPEWFIGVRAGAEEGTELLGTFLCLWGMSLQRRSLPGQWRISQIVPNPYRMSTLTFILPAGMLFYLIVSVLFGGSIYEEGRGNPLAWYPSMLFLIVGFAMLWRAWTMSRRRPQLWAMLGGYFTLSSVVLISMYDIQGKQRLLDALGPFANFFGQFGVQLALLLILFSITYQTLTVRPAVEFVLLGALVFFGYSTGTLVLQYVVAGIFTLIVAYMFFLDHIEQASAAAPNALAQGAD